MKHDQQKHWQCDCVFVYEGHAEAVVNEPSASHCWHCGVSRPHKVSVIFSRDKGLEEVVVERHLEPGDFPGPAEKISRIEEEEDR